MALKIQKKLEVIDSMVDYYQNEIQELTPRLNNLVQDLKTVLANKSMVDELERKLQESLTEIENDYKLNIEDVKQRYSRELAVYEQQLKTIENRKAQDVAKASKGLNLLIEHKDSVVKKIESLSPTTDITPIIKKEQIPNYSIEELNELFNNALEIEKEATELKVTDVNLKYIDKSFWFPAGKLELENRNATDLFRALNVLAVVTSLALFSDVISIGLAGLTTYLGVKNYKELKPLRAYKDYLYTIYEYESDFREVIATHFDRVYSAETSKVNTSLHILNKKKEEELALLSKSMRDETEYVKETFRVQKAEKVQEIREGMDKEVTELKEVTTDILKEFNLLESQFLVEINRLRKDLEEAFEKANNFSLVIPNDNLILNLKRMHLGKESSSPEVNYFRDLPFGSYLFIYKDDKVSMRTLMKYITCQIASRLKGNLVTFNLLDPTDYGEGLSDIVNAKSIDTCFNSEEVKDKIESLLDKFTRDIKNIFIGYDSLPEYNKEKVERGSTPYPYTVNLIQNFNIFDDINTMNRLFLTRKSGIINLVLVSEHMIEEARDSYEGSEVKLEEFYNLLGIFDVMFAPTSNGELVEMKGSIDGKALDIGLLNGEDDELYLVKQEFDGKVKEILSRLDYLEERHGLKLIGVSPFNYEGEKDLGLESPNEFKPLHLEVEQFREWGKQITTNQDDASNPIFYFNDFVKRVVPEGKEMSMVPTSRLLMYPGYVDGDVDKPNPIPLDGQTIHYFMGGRTGMGKSNTLNAIIGTLIRCYSPEHLNIHLMDFKVVEGKKYMVNPTPHFKSISVTKDPYYLISLFDYITAELNYRQKVLLPKYHAGKIGDLREKGIYVPEIVVVIDEVDEGLKTDAETRNKILQETNRIATLGRASGMHLFYTSQGVPDKLDDNTMSQFAGRLALPVTTAGDSKALIMNDSAADSDYQTMGNLIFNNKGGDEKYNVRFKTPMIQPEDMDANFELINRLCGDKYERNCVTFDEGDIRGVDALEELLNKNKAFLKSGNKRQMIIGDTARFSMEPYPEGFELSNDSTHNMFVLSQSKKHRIELTNTLVTNFAYVSGENTNLVVLKGNKDYVSLDYGEKFKGVFKSVTEVEDFPTLIEWIQGGTLLRIENALNESSWNFEDDEFMDVCCKMGNFREVWERMKAENDVESPISKKVVSTLIETLRPHVPEELIIVEGVDEVDGIGMNSYGMDQYQDLLKYSPYYGIFQIWTASMTPQGFDKFSVAFKHRLLGTLERYDLTQYKFMTESPIFYGGYMDVIRPNDPFKFKRYALSNIEDDASKDTRVKLKYL